MNIVNEILEYLKKCNLDLNSLEVVGCDGTVTNTGRKGGIIVLLENKIGRPLQWFVCQLHANELPLRHLFEKLDGNTSGPRAFSGPLGKRLQVCETLSVVSFSKIESSVDEFLSDDLSTDQKYLYDICQAVKSGVCSEQLSKRQPGKMVHSRWLTTASRILRLYVATENPSENLQILSHFVMKVYAPMWFCIKAQPSCIYGARHLFKTIRLCDYLLPELKDLVYKSIQRNGYFGSPENIILAMLFDERKHIRQLGFQRILKSRELNYKDQRHFVVPELFFDAKEYFEIIDCQKVVWTEPPVTIKLSKDQLKEVVENPETSLLAYVTAYPCHTQAVERTVKIVTEASVSVCGREKRDGYIRNRLKSRENMPKYESKKDFFLI